LDRLDLISTLGFSNGTIYDVLSDNQGTGAVSVSAMSFDVSCGFLVNTTVATLFNNNESFSVTVNSSHADYKLELDIPWIGELEDPLCSYYWFPRI
jgi:hypothetical protein